MNSRTQRARTSLTGQDIDQAMRQMADLSISDDPDRLARIRNVARKLVERGEQRGIAAWADDPHVGVERAALLETLRATAENATELEKVALLAHRSIRLNANPDAAGIALATFYSSDKGFDLVRGNTKNKVNVPDGIYALLEKRYGMSLTELSGIQVSVRTERLLELFGYAHSGLLQQDVEAGVLDDKATGRAILDRCVEQAWEVAMTDTRKGNGRGASVYTIKAEQGVIRSGVRPSDRPDTVFVNEKTREIYLGLGFSGHTSEWQKSGVDRFLRPLRDALDKGLIPEWNGFHVVPFYMHAGTFVPQEPESHSTARTRPGQETAKALADEGVSLEAQAALATFDLVGVALRAKSPEALFSFFECNPLVCGVSTLDHLRHVEMCSRLPASQALDAHVAFLCRQAELATEATCAIALCKDVITNTQATFATLSAFVENAHKPLGGMSEKTYNDVFQPALKQIANLVNHLILENENSNHTKSTNEADEWRSFRNKIKRQLNISFETFQEDQEDVLGNGDRGLLAESAKITPNPRLAGAVSPAGVRSVGRGKKMC